MGLNGISTLATKELRQIAKLDLAQTKRQIPNTAGHRAYNIYDLTKLPMKYVGDIPTDNPGNLLPQRPWIKEIQGGSLQFDASSYLSIPASADWAMGLNDFSVEWFQYQTALEPGDNQYSRIFDVGGWPTESIGVSIESGVFIPWVGNTMFPGTDVSASIINNWVHFVFARSAGVLSCYMNGNRFYTGISLENVYDNTAPLTIGYGSDNGWAGYITNFRFVSGNSAYDPTLLTLIVPDTNLTVITGTKLLLTAVDNGTAFTDTSGLGKVITNVGAGVAWDASTPFV